jgi:DamX protein
VAVTAAADKAVERPTPAPVVDRRISAAGTVAAASAATEALPAPQPAPVVDRSRPQTRPARSAKPDWLQSRDPSHYTLQLVGARDRAAIEKFVRQHRIRQPYAVFERNLKGAPWYSLVAGDYPDRAAAVAARAALPAGLERSGVWPRSFASIYQLLK